MIDKNKLIDLLLRIRFVDSSPGVGGAFVMAWAHGMEYNPGLTYTEQFADMCEAVGLPRELPEPKYPDDLWGAFKRKESSEYEEFEEVFVGNVHEVSEWCKKHEGEYHHISSTGRTIQTEQEMFDRWKEKVLKGAGLLS